MKTILFTNLERDQLRKGLEVMNDMTVDADNCVDGDLIPIRTLGARCGAVFNDNGYSVEVPQDKSVLSPKAPITIQMTDLEYSTARSALHYIWGHANDAVFEDANELYPKVDSVTTMTYNRAMEVRKDIGRRLDELVAATSALVKCGGQPG